MVEPVRMWDCLLRSHESGLYNIMKRILASNEPSTTTREIHLSSVVIQPEMSTVEARRHSEVVTSL